MIALHIDFETRSTVEIKKTGGYRYAEDPTTEVLCLSWSIGEGEVFRWEPGKPVPTDLVLWVEQGRSVVAHNAQFEYVIWNGVLRRDYPEFPPLKIDQLSCTMARAYAVAMPPGLDSLATVLGLPAQKDKGGRALMLQMCKPRKVNPDGTYIWWDTPEMRERLGQYCDTDVLVEKDVDKAIPELTKAEMDLWRLDQVINQRGVPVDAPLAARAIACVEEATRRADERMWYLTDGAVSRCSEAGKLIAWLASRGIECTSVAKGEIEDLIARAGKDAAASEALELRRAASKSSTAKFKAVVSAVNGDGRVRGVLQYHGATTGRWAGRIIQPQNFPRVDPDKDAADVERTLELLGSKKTPGQVVDTLEMLTGAPLTDLSKALRAMIAAPAGKVFVGGDFSNIEGRCNAWLAGESWKVKAFRDYDAGTGADLYKLAYARSFDVGVLQVDKQARQIGKVMELACGYQSGVGGFMAMASGYAADIEKIAEVALRVGDPGIIEKAREKHKRMNDFGLGEDVWVGVRTVVDSWRAAHPRITQMWWDLQDAAIGAVSSPGQKFDVVSGRVSYLAAHGFLFCKLPSGRVISYAAPRLVKDGDRNKVEYDAIDSTTSRWGPHSLYGGLQCENIVQAIARDILVETLWRCEDSGYPVVMHVHDEVLCEVDEDGNASEQELQDLMSVVPEWAGGLPVAAATFKDKRYVK